MVTCDDSRLAEELRLLRLHGLQSDAWQRFGTRELTPSLVVRKGFKYNMTDVQAALGLGQLARVEAFLAERERQAGVYDRELAGLPCDRQERPAPGSGHRHGLHLYVLLLRLEQLSASRDQVVRALRAENVGAGIHYDAIHSHPYFASVLPYRKGGFPVAESVADRTLTLPLGPSLGGRDLQDVIAAVHKVLDHYRRG
jgi:dTDP-4-amino-4,6-dideoxygalactose transaminase